MRNVSWLAAAVLVACSSTESTSSPDAMEEDDEVDARPRADARPAADAPLGGQSDAPVGSMADASPGGGPDARMSDAAAGSPDAQVLAVRPWGGAKAKLRLLDLRMAGPEVGVKLCVFDSDSDPRPYSVLVTRGITAGGDKTIEAVYVDVPADSGLRASVHTFFLIGSQQPDTSPAGCDQSKAVELRGSAGLSASAFYTAVYDETDAFFAQCERSNEDGCQFYPQWEGDAADECAADGLRLFRDAHLGSSGYRLINMTADAALLSHTPSLGLKVEVRHVDIPFNFAEVYEETIPGELTYICPEYVACTGADPSVEPFDECTSGDPAWIVGEINEPRIADDGKFTTFYLVGDVRDLASNASGLVGPHVTVVTAHDGSE